MPTPEDAPTALVLEKILPKMTETVGQTGWTAKALLAAAHSIELSDAEIAQALPEGIRSLVPLYLEQAVNAVSEHYNSTEVDSMRIRDKVTSGVEAWLNWLSLSFDASVKAIDWCTVRPVGPLPMTEYIWHVADTIWTGLGAVGVIIGGMILFGDRVNLVQAGFMVMIVIGVMGTKLFAPN